MLVQPQVPTYTSNKFFRHICSVTYNSQKIKSLVFGVMDGKNEVKRPHFFHQTIKINQNKIQKAIFTAANILCV